MILSTRVRALCDDFYASTTEKNEVFYLKWTFPGGAFPDISLEKAEHDFDLAQTTRERVDAWLAAPEAPDDETALRVLRYYCGYIENNYLNYWLTFDFNHYTCPIPTFWEKARTLPLDTAERRALYLEVLRNFPPFIDALGDKLRAQGRRYIRMPEAGCRLVARSLTACLDSVRRTARPPEEAAFTATIAAALERVLAYIQSDALADAPRAIGLGQYPGGYEAYRRQMRTYISCDATPEDVQRAGYAALAETEERMLGIARALGFQGELSSFVREVDADPRFRFSSPAEMQAALTGYLDAARGRMSALFPPLPKADCAVARIQPELEATTSWGYYHIPVDSDRGVYYYSAAELDKRCQIRAPAVVYHELLPGHHYQMNLALEDDTLPALMRHHYNTAYADGWAEYASGLCGDLGLYTPYAEFGRLSWDAFLCCRLIVDTGLNALGWTYGRAADFLRAHTMLTPTEIDTELLRYTIGMPAQALSYKWGSLCFARLRARAQETLGERLDWRDFHGMLVSCGAIPLDILEWRFAAYLARKDASAQVK
jgi:uncharacterized protein (DUF885 family)